MKKIINKYINILTSLIFILAFFGHSYFSYKTYIENQRLSMESSLDFLSSKKDEEDFFETLDEFSREKKDLSIAFFAGDGKELFMTESFNNDIYQAYGKKDSKEVLIRKIFKDSVFIYQTQNQENLVLIKEVNIGKKLDYFQIKYFLFVFMLVILANNFFVGKLVERIFKPVKNISKKDKLSSDDIELIKDLEKFFKKYENKDLGPGKKEEVLQSRIFDVKNITDNMEEGFIYFNNQGVVRIINEAAKTMLGVDKTSKLESLLDDQDYKDALEETKLLSKSKDIDIKVKDKDIKLFIDPIFNGQSFSYIILAIDNSESKRAEMMRREFSANVTHELKSPLTSINGYAELIATGFVKDEDIVKFAEIIYKEGNRLLDIIDDILKLSKLDEKNFDQKKTLVNVRGVCESCINKFQNLSDKKSLTIVNEVEDFSIRTQEGFFVDLITNLYENAIKYNKDGGKIILSSKKIDDGYKLSIEDTGLGIKKDDLDRIFERFYVADKARSRNMKSTGLGLSIVKHICDYLGYDISVESVYGKGSRFILFIKE